jgi:hypothetical protein
MPSAFKTCSSWWYDDTMPVPKPPEETGPSMNADPDFLIHDTSEPHLITLAELNDLVRDLDVSKTKAQLLGSWFKQWNLLEKRCKIIIL